MKKVYKMQKKFFTLQNKIFFALFLLSSLFIFSIGMVINLTYARGLRENEINYKVLETNQLQTEFDSEIDSSQHLAQFLATNDAVLKYLYSDSKKNDLEATDFLKQIAPIESSLNSIQLICRDGSVCSQSLAADPGFYNSLCQGGDDPFWTQSRQIAKYDKSVANVVSFVYPVTTPYGKSFIVLNISYDLMDQYIVSYAIKTDEKAFLCDSKGNIILNYPNTTAYDSVIRQHPEILTLDNATINERVFGVDSAIVSKSLNNNGWILVRIIWIQNITKQSHQMEQYLQLLMLLCSICSLVAASVLAHWLTRPIHDLREACRNVEAGNLTYHMEVSEHDEFGRLKTTFNVMIDRLRGLLAKEIEDEKQKSNLKFQVLQQQINPHFLYNTLDSIRWLGAMQNETNIVEMVTALINLLKYNLSSESITSLEKEVENVKNYITIQKFRYMDTFSVSIDLDPQSLDCEVLKFILQPLVENSILHGFSKAERIYKIKISSSLVDGMLHLKVIDNGSGMTSEELKTVNDNLQVSRKDAETSRHHQIGVRNIQERLKLFIGETCGLHYESTPYIKTVAEIVLPVRHTNG